MNNLLNAIQNAEKNGPIHARISIKNGGGYLGAKGINFPIEVFGLWSKFGWCDVPIETLVTHGYDMQAGGAQINPDYVTPETYLAFIIGSECEVLEILE